MNGIFAGCECPVTRRKAAGEAVEPIEHPMVRTPVLGGRLFRHECGDKERHETLAAAFNRGLTLKDIPHGHAGKGRKNAATNYSYIEAEAAWSQANHVQFDVLSEGKLLPSTEN